MDQHHGDAQVFLDTLSWASDPDGYRDLVSPGPVPEGLRVWNVSAAGERTINVGGESFYPGRAGRMYGWHPVSDSHALLVELGSASVTMVEPQPW